MDIQSKLIKKCLAIRTNYITHQIAGVDDLSYIVTEMLANSETPIDIVLDKLGNMIGEDHKFISRTASDVGENHYIAHFNGDDYYIAETEEWQMLYSLIHLHVLATGNNAISIRVVMDGNLYNFYNNEFTEFDPVKVAAVKSFIVYASERLK